uniref:Innexin n=1 Tax=Macrostomum lignano TaxID=282301 RepID=A0A1I8FT19_9PLAT
MHVTFFDREGLCSISLCQRSMVIFYLSRFGESSACDSGQKGLHFTRLARFCFTTTQPRAESKACWLRSSRGESMRGQRFSAEEDVNQAYKAGIAPNLPNMVGSEFIDFVTKWNIPAYAGVRISLTNGISYSHRACILVLCTMVVTVKQYLLKPIVCFTSNKVTGTNYDSYMENFCWWTAPTLCQWTPSLTTTTRISGRGWRARGCCTTSGCRSSWGLQTVMFYLPRLVWQMHLVNSAAEAAKADGEKREKVVKHIAGSLEHMLFMHREYRTGKLQSLKMRIFRAANLLVRARAPRHGG